MVVVEASEALSLAVGGLAEVVGLLAHTLEVEVVPVVAACALVLLVVELVALSLHPVALVVLEVVLEGALEAFATSPPDAVVVFIISMRLFPPLVDELDALGRGFVLFDVPITQFVLEDDDAMV